MGWAAPFLPRFGARSLDALKRGTDAVSSLSGPGGHDGAGQDAGPGGRRPAVGRSALAAHRPAPVAPGRGLGDAGAGRTDAHAPGLWVRHRDGRQSGGRDPRGGGGLDPVRRPGQFPQGGRDGPAAHPAGGAAVRPLRHPAARHAGDPAAGERRLYHRLEERPRGAAVGRDVRLRRLCRARDPIHAGDRPRRAPDGRLPALRPRPGRRGDHGRERRSGHSR